MDELDRKTLLQCAELLVKQAARLREYEALTEISYIDSQPKYVAQVRLSQPHLEHMRSLVPDQSTGQDAFDTLRKLLSTAERVNEFETGVVRV
jgi:hypothetical protein